MACGDDSPSLRSEEELQQELVSRRIVLKRLCQPIAKLGSFFIGDVVRLPLLSRCFRCGALCKETLLDQALEGRIGLAIALDPQISDTQLSQLPNIVARQPQAQ